MNELIESTKQATNKTLLFIDIFISLRDIQFYFLYYKKEKWDANITKLKMSYKELLLKGECHCLDTMTYNVFSHIFYVRVLHVSPRKPGSHPVTHVPSMSWQSIMFLQCPQSSLQSSPYFSGVHSGRNDFLLIIMTKNRLKKYYYILYTIKNHGPY